MSFDIFLSYRRSDQEIAKLLVEELTSQGVNVWWDQHIEGGEDWRDAIVEGLTDSKVLVILFSEECNASKQLRKELAIADTLDKDIVPVLIEDTKPKGHFLYELAARNWVQVFPNPEKKISELAQKLMQIADVEPSAPITAPVPDQISEDGGVAISKTIEVQTPSKTLAEPSVAAETIRNVTKKARKAETDNRKRRDFLPYKWYELLLLPALGILSLLIFAFMEDDLDDIVTVLYPLSALFFLGVYGILVFPIRYYFRRRRVWSALNSYFWSSLVITFVGGSSLIAAIMYEDGEQFGFKLISEVFYVTGILWLILSVIAFIIYSVLNAQRAIRSFNSNVEKI